MCGPNNLKTLIISSRDRITPGTLQSFSVQLPYSIQFKKIILASCNMSYAAGPEIIYISINEIGGDTISASVQPDMSTFALPVLATSTSVQFKYSADYPAVVDLLQPVTTNTLSIAVRTRNNVPLTPSAEWMIVLLYE